MTTTTKVKKVRDIAMASGFGFYYTKSDDELGLPNKRAKDIILKFIDMIDSELEQFTDENDREIFLDGMHYKLGGLLACIDDSLGHGYGRKHIRLPEDLLNVLHKYQLTIFDHLDKERIDGKTIYVTNPYDAVSSNILEELTADLKEIGYSFSVSAESNYFPARTLRFEFEKGKWNRND
jgi:hypothetical protein